MPTTSIHSALTKDGQHGKLYRYEIEYLAAPDAPPYKWRCWAYEFEHAIEKFNDGDEGFEATRITRLTDGPSHAQKWHKLK
jgi:hypothetical protein